MRLHGGPVLFSMVGCSVLLLVFLGLVIDADYMEYVGMKMRVAADAAALDGVQEIQKNGTANVLAAARGAAARSGFQHGARSVTVAVNNPPSGAYPVNDASGVEVIVARQMPTIFMRLEGLPSVELEARSVAH